MVNVIMKKSKIYFLILIILLLTGCGDETVNNNDSQSSNSKLLRKVAVSNLETTGITSKYSKLESTSCPGFGDIIYSDDKHFISNEDGVNKKYEYNLNMKYSNGTNCKLIGEYQEKVLYVTYNTIGQKCYNYWDDGSTKLYTVFADNSFARLESETSYICDGKWEKEYIIKNPFNGLYEIQYKDYNDGKKIKSSGGSSLVIEENKIYSIYAGIANDRVAHGPFTLYYNNRVYLDFEDVNEKIEKVLNGIVFTNKAVYVPGLVDNGCHEYADGICKNGYKKNEELSKLMGDIVFINESYVVFSDGTTYSMWDPKEFGEEEIW